MENFDTIIHRLYKITKDVKFMSRGYKCWAFKREQNEAKHRHVVLQGPSPPHISVAVLQ